MVIIEINHIIKICREALTVLRVPDVIAFINFISYVLAGLSVCLNVTNLGANVACHSISQD